MADAGQEPAHVAHLQPLDPGDPGQQVARGTPRSELPFGAVRPTPVMTIRGRFMVLRKEEIASQQRPANAIKASYSHERSCRRGRGLHRKPLRAAAFSRRPPAGRARQPGLWAPGRGGAAGCRSTQADLGDERAGRGGPRPREDRGGHAFCGLLLRRRVGHRSAQVLPQQLGRDPPPAEARCSRPACASSCSPRPAPPSGSRDTLPIAETLPQAPDQPLRPDQARRRERAQGARPRRQGLSFAAFRYFNAAGAAEDGSIGEDHDPETHLIPLAIDAAIGKRPVARALRHRLPHPGRHLPARLRPRGRPEPGPHRRLRPAGRARARPTSTTWAPARRPPTAR